MARRISNCRNFFWPKGTKLISTKQKIQVVVIQSYVPDYRNKFWFGVTKELANHNLDLVLLRGTPFGVQAQRLDSSSTAAGTAVSEFRIKFGKTTLTLRRLRWSHYFSPLVIIGQSTSSLESYLLLLVRNFFRLPTVSWGHGRTIATAQNRVAGFLQRVLLLRSQFFFAYTLKSGRRAEQQGFPPENIFVLNNSHPIMGDTHEPDEKTISDLDWLEEIVRDKWCALFIGGLDESKNPEVLFEASRLIYEKFPSFRLLVGGEGSYTPPKVEWALVLGRLDDNQKRYISSLSKVILNPGRIGLVSLDSIALNIPIVTTDWPFHAPEFEYLPKHGYFQCPNDPNSLAEKVLGIAKNEALLAEAQQQLFIAQDPEHFSNFVHNFCAATQIAASVARLGRKVTAC